jgi:hypothetical protein
LTRNCCPLCVAQHRRRHIEAVIRVSENRLTKIRTSWWAIVVSTVPQQMLGAVAKW